MSESITLEDLKSSYDEYIKKVPSGSISIAEELRKENMDILKSIIDFSEGIEWLITVGGYLKDNAIEINLDKELLIDYLNNINEALIQEDFYLVADLFEYEIADYFEKLRVD